MVLPAASDSWKALEFNVEDIDRTRDRQLLRAASCHIMVRIILIMRRLIA